jgi:hypothetical protein
MYPSSFSGTRTPHSPNGTPLKDAKWLKRRVFAQEYAFWWSRYYWSTFWGSFTTKPPQFDALWEILAKTKTIIIS